MATAFDMCKYGFFIHFIIKDSVFPDGRVPKTPDETVENFDVRVFADGLQKMRLDYIILTAWHWQARPLYPSAVSEKWRPGTTPRRDLLGEIIDELNRRNIKVILYSHPRDGHDFVDAERAATGWSLKRTPDDTDSSPDYATFDYHKWNQYTQEMYKELMERYGDRIIGVYTDGGGPYTDDGQPVVDYHGLRNTIINSGKGHFMIQNFFGDPFTNDYEMPEAYFGYEIKHAQEYALFPANRKALAFCPFKSGWAALKPKGTDAALMKPEEILRFTLFNASCTKAGGTCWAAGPFCTGEWEDVVIDTMAYVGQEIRRYQQSALNTMQSPSYPTVSGDCLESKEYRFFTTCRNLRYEYLHIMQPQTEIRIPKADDGAVLISPVSLCDSVRVTGFELNADGTALLRLEGDFDKIDTVIQFERRNNAGALNVEWVNETSHRVYMTGEWHQYHLVRDYEIPRGSFENDYHTAQKQGDSAFLAFDGDYVELYGPTLPGHGRANVFVDRIYKGIIDEDGPNAMRQLLYRSEDLCGGEHHTIEIRLIDDKQFAIDAFRILKRPQ